MTDDDDLVMMDGSPVRDIIVVADGNRRGRSPTPAPTIKERSRRQRRRDEEALNRDRSRLRQMKADLDRKLAKDVAPDVSEPSRSIRKDIIPIRAIKGEQRWDIKE